MISSIDASSIALRGIASYSAVSGLWAIASPPASAMARMPSVPSFPVPDSTMPIDRSPRSRARDRKKVSIGSLRPRGS
ncbi:MAG TPA: hypothetical protein VIK13_14775 [Candidatus Limnocylindrales bacterium]